MAEHGLWGKGPGLLLCWKCPQQTCQGRGLSRVSGHGACCVGLDQVKIFGLEARVSECHLHRPQGLDPIRAGADDVTGIGTAANASDDTMNRCLALPSLLKALKHEYSRTLPHHKAAAGSVKGPAGLLGRAGGPAQGLHSCKCRYPESIQDGLRSTGHNHLYGALTEQGYGPGDCFSSPGAGRYGGFQPAAGAQVQADLGGWCIGHDQRHGMGAHLRRAPLLQHVQLLDQTAYSANARTEDHPNLIPAEMTGVVAGPGLCSSDQAKLAAAVETARLMGRQHSLNRAGAGRSCLYAKIGKLC